MKIIDDINVSECRHFQDKYMEEELIIKDFCVLNMSECQKHCDCDYKKRIDQEKRNVEKTKEIMKLHTEINKHINCYKLLATEHNAVIQQNWELQKANKELREEIDKLKLYSNISKEKQ